MGTHSPETIHPVAAGFEASICKRGDSNTTLRKEFSYGSEGSPESLLIKLIHDGLRGCRSMNRKDSQRGCKDAIGLLIDQMLDDSQPKELTFKIPSNDFDFLPMVPNVRGKV